MAQLGLAAEKRESFTRLLGLLFEVNTLKGCDVREIQKKGRPMHPYGDGCSEEQKKRTTLTRFLEFETWTLLMACLLVSGIEPPEGCTEIPKNAMGLDWCLITEKEDAFHFARWVLELWNSRENAPARVRPIDFVAWCKSKKIDTCWLSEIDDCATPETQNQRRQRLDAAGLKHISAAPSPIEPIVGSGAISGITSDKHKSAPLDWRHWKHAKLKLWEACALSLNISPENMKHHPQGWMAGPGSGPIFTDASFPNKSVQSDFYKRLRLLNENYTDSKYFTDINNLYQGCDHAEVTLQNFVSWGLSVDFENMPPELLAMTAPEPQATTSPAPVPQATHMVTDKAGPDWSLKTIQRTPGYRWPLYQTLKAAHIAGKPCPKAQHVLDEWKLTPPNGLKVIQLPRRDELEYELETGKKKCATVKQVQAAIKGLLSE